VGPILLLIFSVSPHRSIRSHPHVPPPLPVNGLPFSISRPTVGRVRGLGEETHAPLPAGGLRRSSPGRVRGRRRRPRLLFFPISTLAIAIPLLPHLYAGGRPEAQYYGKDTSAPPPSSFLTGARAAPLSAAHGDVEVRILWPTAPPQLAGGRLHARRGYGEEICAPPLPGSSLPAGSPRYSSPIPAARGYMQ
jgi:hypothetical protein